MNITIPPDPANNPGKIDVSIGTLPRRQFRRVWTLPLTTDQFAEQIILNASDSRLKAKFLPHSFDITSTDIIQSTLQKRDNETVIVTLDQPLQIESIHVGNSITGQLKLYRMDGSAIAPSPTVTHSIRNSKTNTLAHNFTAAKFAIRKGNNTALAPSDIQQIYVQSYPTASNISLLDPRKTPPTLIPLWQAELPATTETTDHLTANISDELTAPIQRYLNSLVHPFSNPLTLIIIATSDTPCKLALNQFSLSYHLKKETFFTTPDLTKQALRFTSATLTPKTIDIKLPPNSTPRSATIRFADSTQPADPLISANSLVANPASTPPLKQNTGIQTEINQWIGQCFTPNKVQKISGLLLGLLPLQADTQLILELQPDANGLPSGEPIVSTPIKLRAIGKRRWYALSIDALTLDARPYWCLLSATQGKAVWMTAPNTTEPNTTKSVKDSAYLFSRTTAAQIFERLQHYTGQTAMFQLKTVIFESDEETESPASENAIAFRINNIDLPALRSKNTIKVDLLSALSATPESTQLSIAVSRPSILTAYPPVIEYDL